MAQRALQCTGYKKTSDKKNFDVQCTLRGEHVKFARPGGHHLERCRHHKNDNRGAQPIFSLPDTNDEEDRDDRSATITIERPRLASVSASGKKAEPCRSSARFLTPPASPAVTSFETDTLLNMDSTGENFVFGEQLTRARRRQVCESLEPKQKIHSLLTSPGKDASKDQKIRDLATAAISSFERLNLADASTNALANLAHANDHRWKEQDRTNADLQRAAREAQDRVARLELAMNRSYSREEEADTEEGADAEKSVADTPPARRWQFIR